MKESGFFKSESSGTHEVYLEMRLPAESMEKIYFFARSVSIS